MFVCLLRRKQTRRDPVSNQQSDKLTIIHRGFDGGLLLVMGNNVSGISTLQRGQQQGFHRLRNSQKGQ